MYVDEISIKAATHALGFALGKLDDREIEKKLYDISSENGDKESKPTVNLSNKKRDSS